MGREWLRAPGTTHRDHERARTTHASALTSEITGPLPPARLAADLVLALASPFTASGKLARLAAPLLTPVRLRVGVGV